MYYMTISKRADTTKRSEYKDKGEQAMKRYQIAQYIALGATASTVIGFCLTTMAGISFGSMLMVIGFIAGIVSYCFGGLLTAIRMAGGIAKFGWFVVPFPYDLITFFFTFFASIMVFIFLPIIPVRKAYKENMAY